MRYAILIICSVMAVACGDAYVGPDGGAMGPDAGQVIGADAGDTIADAAPMDIDARNFSGESFACDQAIETTRTDDSGVTTSITRVYVAWIEGELAGKPLEMCYEAEYAFPGGGCSPDENGCTEVGSPVTVYCFTVFANRDIDGNLFVSCGSTNSRDNDRDGVLDPFTGVVADSVTAI
jgi:hypothetical protein